MTNSKLWQQAAGWGQVGPCYPIRKVDSDRWGSPLTRAGRQRGLEVDGTWGMIRTRWKQNSMWAVLWGPGMCLCPSQLDRGYGTQGMNQRLPAVCGSSASCPEEQTDQAAFLSGWYFCAHFCLVVFTEWKLSYLETAWRLWLFLS